MKKDDDEKPCFVSKAVSGRTRSRWEAFYRSSIPNKNKNNATGSDQAGRRTDEEEANCFEGCDDDDEETTAVATRPCKRRGGSQSKKHSLAKLMEEFMEEEEKVDVSRFQKQTQIPDSASPCFPSKFRFEDDQVPPVSDEEMKWNKEIDSLFNEMEMALWQCETGSTTHDPRPSISDDETQASRCGRGEHDAFLDEEIGILCRFCSSLLLDIRLVLPPMVEKDDHARRTSRIPERSKSDTSAIDAGIEFEEPPRVAGGVESPVDYNGGTGTVVDLIRGGEKQLYPHQLEAFEFVWRRIAGDFRIPANPPRNPPENGSGGCIICHAPGTGKTRLTIVFLETYMKLYPGSRPAILAPRGMLLSWEQEFKKWKSPIHFHNLNDAALDKDNARFVKISSWIKGGSVLGIGYRLFKELAGENRRRRTHKPAMFKKILLESPGLLVLDEGHTPRNKQSLVWKAITKVTTKRRIILSGTPFQNNFTELFTTLSLVNPRFSSSNTKKINGEEEITKLKALIAPFVHIYRGGILHDTLPGINEALIVLNPADLQTELLEKTLTFEKFLVQEHVSSLISVHPSIVMNRPEFLAHRRKLKAVESDPNAGVKTRFLFKLIELSVLQNEKVLVFSQYIDPLLHIKKLLKSKFKWGDKRELIYIDGVTGLELRQGLIDSFNDEMGEAKVMLASQRACFEGISLVGASRVVLLDVVWNPAVERQAVSRAYRIGQRKVVHVYRLVTEREVEKCGRQAEKERVSELLFSETVAAARGCEAEVREDGILSAMLGHESLRPIFQRIVHQPNKQSDFGFLGKL